MPLVRQGDPGWKDPFRAKKKKAKPSVTRKIARQEARRAVRTIGERKYWDSTSIAAPIDYSGTSAVYNLFYDPLSTTQIAQGTDDNDYIGKKIRPIYIHIRGIITRADNNNTLRCIIVQTKTNNVPTLAGILQSVGNVRAPYSAYERQFNDQWRILYDRTWLLTTYTFDAKVFNIKIRRRKLSQVGFQNAAGTIEKGGIYMCWISDSSASTHPNMEYYSRITFTDV